MVFFSCLCDGHLGIAYANILATTQWPLERAAHLTSLVWVCVLWLPESLMDLSALCIIMSDIKLLTYFQTSIMQPLKFTIEKQFYPTIYCSCDYLSMLGFKLLHTSKKEGPGHQLQLEQQERLRSENTPTPPPPPPPPPPLMPHDYPYYGFIPDPMS